MTDPYHPQLTDVLLLVSPMQHIKREACSLQQYPSAEKFGGSQLLTPQHLASEVLGSPPSFPILLGKDGFLQAEHSARDPAADESRQVPVNGGQLTLQGGWASTWAMVAPALARPPRPAQCK